MSAAHLPAEVRTNPLAWVSSAREMALACCDVEQLGSMASQAAALVAYLRAEHGRASEQARAAAELELVVKRRIGELLPKGEPGRGKKNVSVADVFGEVPGARQAASEARKLAEVPAEAFAAYLEQQAAQGETPSAAGVLRAGRAQEQAAEGDDDDPVAIRLAEEFGVNRVSWHCAHVRPSAPGEPYSPLAGRSGSARAGCDCVACRADRYAKRAANRVVLAEQASAADLKAALMAVLARFPVASLDADDAVAVIGMTRMVVAEAKKVLRKHKEMDRAAALADGEVRS